MLAENIAKFGQNTQLRNVLLAGDRLLAEQPLKTVYGAQATMQTRREA